MAHPIGEIAAGVIVVLALGASTLWVLPRSTSAPPRETIVLDVAAPSVERAEPLSAKTEAERVADLERQLTDLAAEHKELSERVKAIVQEASRAEERKKRRESR